MLFDDDGVLSKVGQNVTIEKIIKHPEFAIYYEFYYVETENERSQEIEEDYEWNVFDAAIIKLKSQLKFGIDVKPACLPEPKFAPEQSGENAIDSGWGVGKSVPCLFQNIENIEDCKPEGNNHTNF